MPCYWDGLLPIKENLLEYKLLLRNKNLLETITANFIQKASSFAADRPVVLLPLVVLLYIDAGVHPSFFVLNSTTHLSSQPANQTIHSLIFFGRPERVERPWPLQWRLCAARAAHGGQSLRASQSHKRKGQEG